MYLYTVYHTVVFLWLSGNVNVISIFQPWSELIIFRDQKNIMYLKTPLKTCKNVFLSFYISGEYRSKNNHFAAGTNWSSLDLHITSGGHCFLLKEEHLEKDWKLRSTTKGTVYNEACKPFGYLLFYVRVRGIVHSCIFLHDQQVVLPYLL